MAPRPSRSYLAADHQCYSEKRRFTAGNPRVASVTARANLPATHQKRYVANGCRETPPCLAAGTQTGEARQQVRGSALRASLLPGGRPLLLSLTLCARPACQARFSGTRVPSVGPGARLSLCRALPNGRWRPLQSSPGSLPIRTRCVDAFAVYRQREPEPFIVDDLDGGGMVGRQAAMIRRRG